MKRTAFFTVLFLAAFSSCKKEIEDPVQANQPVQPAQQDYRLDYIGTYTGTRHSTLVTWSGFGDYDTTYTDSITISLDTSSSNLVFVSADNTNMVLETNGEIHWIDYYPPPHQSSGGRIYQGASSDSLYYVRDYIYQQYHYQDTWWLVK